MAEIASRRPARAFVVAMRKVYHPAGFKKGYNFVLWCIFAGAMLGFCLARFQYLDYYGVYCPETPSPGRGAAPGECYRYNSRDLYRIGIQLHLYTILPAGFLACFQFVPAIRYKALLFHRINGYLVVLLSLVGTAGALMIARISFGGGVDTQTAVGLMAIMFVAALAISLYNVKKLQLEQHRAWMLRAWFYAGSIITMRLIGIIMAQVTSIQGMGPYFVAYPCDVLASFYRNSTVLHAKYPACSSLSAHVPVEANFNLKSPETIGASMQATFGTALWLALAVHAIGVEIYLHLTPAEANRLRNISYQRQIEAGYCNAGRAGLTADRLGDAAIWRPEEAAIKEDLEDASITPSVHETPTAKP